MNNRKKPPGITKGHIVLLICIALYVFISNRGGLDSIIPPPPQNSPAPAPATALSRTEQIQAFNKIDTEVTSLFVFFDKVDASFEKTLNTNASDLDKYEHIKILRDKMEEGQSKNLIGSIPEGFSIADETELIRIDSSLYNMLQYRKFAYENLMEYLDKGELEKASTSKKWLNDAYRVTVELRTRIDALRIKFPASEVVAVVTPIEQKVDGAGYKVIEKVEALRADGGNNYYVLIDPVDLSNSDFINNVKTYIDELTTTYGKKISIEFYDDLNALNLDYKQTGIMTLGRNLTAEENRLLTRHYIAGYSGELSTDLYTNTLYLFPCAGSEPTSVDKYATIIEYNPK